MIAQHRDPEWPGLRVELWRAATHADNPDLGLGSPLCAGLACYAFAHGELPVKARQLHEDVVIPALRAASPWHHMLAPATAHAAAAI